jgi:hypothetical protein
LVDGSAVEVRDGAGGGDVLPLEDLIVPGETGVTRLIGGEIRVELTVIDDADADAGGESDKEGLAVVETLSLGESRGAGVVGDGDGEVEGAHKLLADVSDRPGEIAIEYGLTAQDGPREGDSGGAEGGGVKLGAEVGEETVQPAVLIDISEEADGVEEAAAAGEGGDESLGGADVDSEIHKSIVPPLGI